MNINSQTIDFRKVRKLLDSGRSVIIFIRHSERPEICVNDRDFGITLGLTDNGIAMAREVGSHFKGIQDVTFFSSPMDRCRLTARYLAEGMGINQPQVSDTPEIGIEGFYMHPDRHSLQALMKKHGYMEYMQSYLNKGTAPYLNPIKKATVETIGWMRGVTDSKLSFFVSHDIYITAFITALGIRKFKGDDWIGFLHSAVLSFDKQDDDATFYHAVPCLKQHGTPACFSQ